MSFRVSHATTYSYTEPVTLCHNVVRLLPRACPTQSCHASTLNVEPPPAVQTLRSDYFGNPTAHFTVQEPHRQLTITSVSEIEPVPAPSIQPEETAPWEQVRDALAQDRSLVGLDAFQFAFDSVYVQATHEMGGYAEESFVPGRPVLAALLDLTRRIHAEFRYDPRATTLATPLRQVFQERRGVCQDFAHLQIACLRSLGLAARYVSGYLQTDPPPGQPRLIGADASHAWVSVYLPGLRWVDLDPTNNTMPGSRHVTLAWGRDYDDVSPIKGVILGGGRQTIRVNVDVEPLTQG